MRSRRLVPPLGEVYKTHRFGALEHLVLMPHAIHQEIVSENMFRHHVVPNAFAHVQLRIDDEKRAMVVEEIQSDISSRNPFSPISSVIKTLRQTHYRNWHVSMLLTAAAYAQSKGYRLFVTTPEHHFRRWKELGFAKQSADEIYGATVRVVSKILGVREKSVLTTNIFGPEFDAHDSTKVFGEKLKEILLPN